MARGRKHTVASRKSARPKTGAVSNEMAADLAALEGFQARLRDAAIKAAMSIRPIRIPQEVRRILANLEPELREGIRRDLSIPEILALEHAIKKKGRRGAPSGPKTAELIEAVAKFKAEGRPYVAQLAQRFYPYLPALKGQGYLRSRVFKLRPRIDAAVLRYRS